MLKGADFVNEVCPFARGQRIMAKSSKLEPTLFLLGSKRLF